MKTLLRILKEMKLTLAQKLEKKKFKRPPAVIYPLLLKVIVKSLARKWNVHFEFNVDTSKIKPPFVVVFNHQSRNDYVFTSLAFPKTRLNYVAGYNEFFRAHLKFIFSLCQAIPKRNFVPDLHAVMEATRIIRQGGAICFSPEGMSSISGTNQPVALGSGKFLKHLGVPVYYVNIKGAYLMAPKYCLDDRIGKVSVVTDLLFTEERLNCLSDREIDEELNRVMTHDDYKYNKQVRVRYSGKDFAKNMHTFLYKCPKCKKEFTMKGEGDRIYCTECGNGAAVNEYYDLIPLSEDCVIFDTPSDWYQWQRETVHEEILSNNSFRMTEKVKLGTLPDYKYLKNHATSEITGEGVIELSREGFSFAGKKNGKPIAFSIPTNILPTYGMCTDMTRFYTFYEKTFYEFYPETECVAKWFLATEEMHRINGGSWKSPKYPL